MRGTPVFVPEPPNWPSSLAELLKNEGIDFLCSNDGLLKVVDIGLEARMVGDSSTVMLFLSPANTDLTTTQTHTLASACAAILARWRRFTTSSPPIQKLLYEEWNGKRWDRPF